MNIALDESRKLEVREKTQIFNCETVIPWVSSTPVPIVRDVPGVELRIISR